MFQFIKAIILGIVEGITEFLPVSSTGHLILVNRFISFEKGFTEMFDVIIQMGAILAVIIYFKDKLIPFIHNDSIKQKNIFSIWKKTIIGVLPALVIGVLIADYIETQLFNPFTVSIALIIGGIILIFIEKRNKISRIDSIEQLGYGTAFMIGVIQCLAMIPGTSRSAATIIGAMALGASRVVAAEFSFFLAIPTILAASAYSFLKLGSNINIEQFIVLILGFLASFFVAWLVIASFMRYISKKDFSAFGYYRIILGILVLILLVM